MMKIGNDWDELLSAEFQKEYYKQLSSFLLSEYSNKTIYPQKEDIFRALKLTPYCGVKAVILGQDPYHEPRQAQGLAFSVPNDVVFPPSLINILKELKDDLGIELDKNHINSGVLEPWAKQGVLLLNTVLTVEEHRANSHKEKGWEQFTDSIIQIIAEKRDPVVFILWGENAKKKEKLILDSAKKSRHLIMTAPHPSPLSAYRGFFGGRYFSKTNEFLVNHKIKPINWSLG